MASYESYPQPEDETGNDSGKKKLKVVLGAAVIVLAVVAVGVGVTVWRNSTLPSARQADTEALTQSSAGLNDTKFSKVDLEGVPTCKKMYGNTYKQLKQANSSTLSFASMKKGKEGSAGLSQSVQKKISYVASASVKSQADATVTVFFDKDKKSVAMVYSFDLDELGVAEADFSVLAADKVVPSSLLLGVGLSKAVASKKALPTPSVSSSASENSCTFEGATGEQLKKVTQKKKVYNKKKHKKVTKKVVKKVQTAYMSWNLSERYVRSTDGATTIRTATISLS